MTELNGINETIGKKVYVMQKSYPCPQCGKDVLYITNPCPNCKLRLDWTHQPPIPYIPPTGEKQQQSEPQFVKATQQPIYQPPVEEVQQHRPVLGVQTTVKWSEDFTHLQHLIKENKAALSLKKSRIMGGQHFFLWLYWDCETRPSILNLFGKSFILLQWVLLNELVWIALSIILAILINWFFLLCILIPVIIKALLNPIGQGFMIYDARNNENLFDDLWQNQAICIMSVKRHESPIHKDGVPDIIIEPYNQNWREEISKAKF